MKKRRSELAILLLALVLFSGGMSLLHGITGGNNTTATANTKKAGLDIIKKKLVLAQKIHKANKNELKGNILKHLEPLAASESIGKMATYLKPFDPGMVISVLQAIKNGQGPRLSTELQQALVLALAMRNTAMRPKLYRFVVKNYAQEPLFLTALTHKNADTINHVKTIFGTSSPEYIQFMNNSVDAIIVRDDARLLKQLSKFDVSAVVDRANTLLHQVVIENKDRELVSLLIKAFKANANYSKDGKKTVLMYAVEQSNEPLVKVLLAQGADPALALDVVEGSARDIAFKKGLVDIELLLLK